MYERRGDPLLTWAQFARRFLLHLGVGLGMVVVALFLGAAGYHGFEGLSWLDSTLNASMLLSGMGPLHTPTTVAGKVFATCYALFSGLMFVVLSGVLLAPVLHRILHHFHLAKAKDDD